MQGTTGNGALVSCYTRLGSLDRSLLAKVTANDRTPRNSLLDALPPLSAPDWLLFFSPLDTLFFLNVIFHTRLYRRYRENVVTLSRRERLRDKLFGVGCNQWLGRLIYPIGRYKRVAVSRYCSLNSIKLFKKKLVIIYFYWFWKYRKYRTEFRGWYRRRSFWIRWQIQIHKLHADVSQLHFKMTFF